jgi:L,D-peptidoglycan transpeptidase YkuD (ErfK/YbiS/YcfS/YnhG family)
MRLRRTKQKARLAGDSRQITLFSSPGERHRGVLRCGSFTAACALGRGGVRHLKREGDGGTPAGRHRLLSLYVRRDRLPGPRSRLPMRAMRRNDGWCEDVASGNYNRALRLPSPAGHETMWRDDRLYDIVGVLDWNVSPRIRGRGSAIFLHLARSGFAPTAGCIALRLQDLKRLLACAGRRPEFLVAAKQRRVPQGRRPAVVGIRKAL